MESKEPRICRFCFSSLNRLIDIFDESETNVLEIITEHVGEVNDLLVYDKNVYDDSL